MPASERAASTFTLAGKARQASVAGPSKMSVSSRRASRSIFRSTTHGAPASPFGGLRDSIVTEVMRPIAAPFTPSSPAMAPDGTRIRAPFASARAIQSSRPSSAPQESTTRSRPAPSAFGAISCKCACVDASTTRSEAATRASRSRKGGRDLRLARNDSARSRVRAVAPASTRPGSPASMARQTWRPIAPRPTMPTLIGPRAARIAAHGIMRQVDVTRRAATTPRAALSRFRLRGASRPRRHPVSPALCRRRRPRDRRPPHRVPGLRPRGSLRPRSRAGAVGDGPVARGLRPRVRCRAGRRRLRRLHLSVQPAARPRGLLRGRAGRAGAPRHAGEVLPRGRRRAARADRPGPGALRARLPGRGPPCRVSPRPQLARLPPPVSAAVRRRALQAPAALPALDGAAGGARLRPLDGRVAVAAADPRRHPRREHEPGRRPHAPALAELEDGGRDHRAPGAARSRRSGEVRLRAVSHAHGRRLPRPPRPGGVPAVRTARGLPSLEAGRGPPEASMTEVTGILLGALLVVLAVVAWTLFAARRELAQMRSQPPVPDPSVALLRQEIESVRHEGREDQEHLRREVGALTGEVTRQLEEGMKLIHAGQTSIGARLDAATKVVGDVQGSLGTLQEATRRVAEIGREIQGLEQVLKSPKMRGGLGETLLERLLDEMLPREHWMTQHGFRSGEKVDAAIRIGERIVPVDAKFPLENFRRMLAEADEAQRQHRKVFARDVKARVDEIAKKYILPDEGTYDFALMYVPAENVYYEIAVRPEDSGEEPIGAYALSRRVVPVSPNSIFAYLQVIVLGLKGLRIEANARRIQEDLARLGGDVAKLRQPLATLGRHLGNAQEQYEDAQRELDRLETKLDEIARKGGDAALGEAAPEPPTLPGVV